MQKIKYEQVNIKIFRIEKSVTFQKENNAFDDKFLNAFPSKTDHWKLKQLCFSQNEEAPHLQ